jgi:hypothetical protein
MLEKASRIETAAEAIRKASLMPTTPTNEIE